LFPELDCLLIADGALDGEVIANGGGRRAAAVPVAL